MQRMAEPTRNPVKMSYPENQDVAIKDTAISAITSLIANVNAELADTTQEFRSVADRLFGSETAEAGTKEGGLKNNSEIAVLRIFVEQYAHNLDQLRRELTRFRGL